MINNSFEAKPFYIWEGVYDSFQAASAASVGLGFGGEVYGKRSHLAAQECLAALNAGQPIPQFHKQRSTFLPCSVAMMLSGNTSIRVLDFGGGLGIGYMTLAESISNDLENVDYFILEVPEVSAVGKVLLEERVTYLPDFPFGQTFDFIHAASSFQYIEHWKDLIEKFSLLSPKYILLSDVFAGSINSFVSLQNYYGSKIPHWFLNLQDLLDAFEKHGYRLMMKSYTTSRRLDVEDALPMDNFPEALRLPQSLHLLLKAKA
jgi:putative methyltransferase (TIGR04325 family)